MRPERLNLAIARRCPVSCRGCYTHFGSKEPDLHLFLSSVAAFARLGVHQVTLSGGDPLTIEDLLLFLAALRTVHIRSIKLDTVGVGLTSGSSRSGTPQFDLKEILEAVDFLGIPLDGWSNESVLAFRQGRPALYSETIELLDTIDRMALPPKVIINTVVHRDNIGGLNRIKTEVLSHPSVCHWNLFQFTPTDQAAPGANSLFRLDEKEFALTQGRLIPQTTDCQAKKTEPAIEFHSSRSRLGRYLLINSDGEAWLPNEQGETIMLGTVFGRERQVLELWVDAVIEILGQLPDKAKTNLPDGRLRDQWYSLAMQEKIG